MEQNCQIVIQKNIKVENFVQKYNKYLKNTLTLLIIRKRFGLQSGELINSWPINKCGKNLVKKYESNHNQVSKMTQWPKRAS